MIDLEKLNKKLTEIFIGYQYLSTFYPDIDTDYAEKARELYMNNSLFNGRVKSIVHGVIKTIRENDIHINRKAKSFDYNVECFSRMTSKAFKIEVTAVSVPAAITEVAKKSKDFNEGHYSVINCTILRSIE